MTTYTLDPDQFGVIGFMGAVLVGLLVIIAVGVFRR